jgi:hypothetical protein
MVQEVGNTLEENGMAILYALVGHSSSKVSFATAAGALEQKPSPGFSGKVLCHLIGPPEPLLVEGVSASSIGHQIIESEARERPQIAVFLEASQASLLQFFLHAAAGHHPTEIRFACGQKGVDESTAVAQGTGGLRYLSV